MDRRGPLRHHRRQRETAVAVATQCVCERFESMPDLVIVGGGIVGATAAWHATRRGASVVLLDARDAGRATDAGAGIVSPETDLRDATPNHLLSAAAKSYYPELIAALEREGHSETGYARCGKLVVALNDEQAEWI